MNLRFVTPSFLLDSLVFVLQAALSDRLVRPIPPSTSPLMHGSETMEMQVDQPEGFGTGEGGVEGEGVGQQQQQKFLKVDGDVLERGLRELVPSLCAYLRGHTEVSWDGAVQERATGRGEREREERKGKK